MKKFLGFFLLLLKKKEVKQNSLYVMDISIYVIEYFSLIIASEELLQLFS